MVSEEKTDEKLQHAVHDRTERPQLEDVECYFEFMEPRLDDFRLKFRGRRSLPQRLVICGLVALFIVSWVSFLRRDGSLFEGRSTGVDDLVLNDTLGVCNPGTSWYWKMWLTVDKSSSTYLHLRYQRDGIEPNCSWTPPRRLILT